MEVKVQGLMLLCMLSSGSELLVGVTDERFIDFCGSCKEDKKGLGI